MDCPDAVLEEPAQEMDVQRRMGVYWGLSKSHQTLCLHSCIMPKTTVIMVSRLLDSLEEGWAETTSSEWLTSCSPNRPAKMTAATWKGLRMCRRLSIWITLSSLSRTITILSLPLLEVSVSQEPDVAESVHQSMITPHSPPHRAQCLGVCCPVPSSPRCVPGPDWAQHSSHHTREICVRTRGRHWHWPPDWASPRSAASY